MSSFMAFIIVSAPSEDAAFCFYCCHMMPILQGKGSSSFRIPVASARIAPTNQTHSWNRGNLPFGGACIMDGLKEIRQGAALPAVDAACPGSLEISGHCLAAARVIASLLVGPEKKRAQDKRLMYKTGRGEEETEEKSRSQLEMLHIFREDTIIAFTP